MTRLSWDGQDHLTKGGPSPTRGNDSNWATNAPVFSIEFEGEGLPSIWITQPVEPPTAERTGRNCLHRYPGALVGEETEEEDDPLGWFDMEGDEDEDGSLALWYGGHYYDEGMRTRDPLFRQDRLDCFRAAEVLYLWSASKGNAQAFANLGYVYSYDRCEGRYLGMDETASWVDGWPDNPGPYPHERRAFECLEHAAQLGHPEACYKLGDLLRDGRGCEANPARAFLLWRKAYELAQEQDVPVWWGSAALRLGGAYENGEVCKHDFAEALRWYERAATGLQIAVDHGDWYYRKALAGARDGATRCQQELSGEY